MIEVKGKKKGTILAMAQEIALEFGLEKEHITVVSKKTRHKEEYHALAWHNFFIPYSPGGASAAFGRKGSTRYKITLFEQASEHNSYLRRVLRHEMMHIKQFASGALQYTHTAVIWEGVPYYQYDYDDCPWENQARAVECQTFDDVWHR